MSQVIHVKHADHFVSVVARKVFKEFPEARQVDKQTPYNERRKMGHFSWTTSKSLEKIIVNFYVVHKVSKCFFMKTSPSNPSPVVETLIERRRTLFNLSRAWETIYTAVVF